MYFTIMISGITRNCWNKIYDVQSRYRHQINIRCICKKSCSALLYCFVKLIIENYHRIHELKERNLLSERWWDWKSLSHFVRKVYFFGGLCHCFTEGCSHSVSSEGLFFVWVSVLLSVCFWIIIYLYYSKSEIQRGKDTHREK